MLFYYISVIQQQKPLQIRLNGQYDLFLPKNHIHKKYTYDKHYRLDESKKEAQTENVISE
jgi:hypothetical protein